MMHIKECLTDDADILLVGAENVCDYTKKSDVTIFRKNFNHAEFIGEGLCGIRNLRCAHYFLIGEWPYKSVFRVKYKDIKKYNYHILLGSFDFKEDDFVYFGLAELKRCSSDKLSVLLSMCPNDKNRNQLINEILEMFALDTFMGQVDRFDTNIIFMRNKKTMEIHLASLYDFQYSLKSEYRDSNIIYANPLYELKNMESYRRLIEEYPQFREMLNSYLNVELSTVVRNCYDSRGLIVPPDRFRYYDDFSEKQKCLIKGIIQ